MRRANDDHGHEACPLDRAPSLETTPLNQEAVMLTWAISWFVLSIVAALLGFSGLLALGVSG
jgi:hypothetical protein